MNDGTPAVDGLPVVMVSALLEEAKVVATGDGTPGGCLSFRVRGSNALTIRVTAPKAQQLCPRVGDEFFLAVFEAPKQEPT